MSGWRRGLRGTMALLRRRRAESELEDELRHYFDAAVDRAMAAGMSRKGAERAARIAMGSAAAVKDEVRDVGWEVRVETMWRDIRYAARALRRSGGFAPAAILTLAIGLGAATAIFTIVYSVLLRPLPYPDPERIVQLWERGASGGRMAVSDPNYRDIRDMSRTFDGLTQYATGDASVVVNRDALLARMALVSDEFFEVMGVRPMLGRTFRPEERHFGSLPLVIVSERFWRQQLGANAELSALSLRTADRLAQVVGVMPAGFAFPDATDLWASREQWQEHLSGRTGRMAMAMGRLRADVSLAQGQQEISAIARQLKEQYGSDTSAVDAALVQLQEAIIGDVRPVLLMLLGAVAFLLLVVAANVLNLLLTRTASRSREVALRMALGAGRSRVVRELVLETLLLSGVAAVTGAVLAAWSVGIMQTLAPESLPRVSELSVGWPVLLFGGAVALTISIAIGVVAARHGTSTDVHGVLRQEFGAVRRVAASRLRASLVVGQIGITLVLLIGTGLLGRSILRLLQTDPGFRTSGVLAMSWHHPPIPNASVFDEPGAADADRHRRAQLLDAAVEGLRRLPGVLEVGVVDAMPLTGMLGSGTFGVLTSEDDIEALLRSEPRPDMAQLFRGLFSDKTRTGGAGYRSASSGYFRAMDIPLIRGRLFDARDTLNAPHVAVISETLARTRWPNEDPLGLRLEFGNMDGDLRPLTIVGIVGDVRDVGLDSSPRPLIYTCPCQRPARTFSLVLHAETTALVAASAERVLRELSPDVPVQTASIERVVGTWLEWRRFVLFVLAFFGIAALLLAIVGTYAAFSYDVAQQTREIGIRLALGAPRGLVLLMVLRRAVMLALIGTVIGAAAATASARWLAALLYEVTPTDPFTYGSIAGLLVMIALIASWLPARRAARLDPTMALRAE